MHEFSLVRKAILIVKLEFGVTFPFFVHRSHVLPSVFVLKVCVVVPVTALGWARLVAICLPMLELFNVIVAMLAILHFCIYIIVRMWVIVGKDCAVVAFRIV
jgi:hypothetical protein